MFKACDSNIIVNYFKLCDFEKPGPKQIIEIALENLIQVMNKFNNYLLIFETICCILLTLKNTIKNIMKNKMKVK